MQLNISVLQNSVLKQHLERKIFRAYDIRGHLNILTPNLIQQIGLSLGTMMRRANQQQVVVGYDARLTSAEYAQIMVQALSDSGLKVIFIGCVSSPVLYFSAGLYGGNGVMVTTSHNAVTDNGVKWLIQGLPPTPQQIQTVADQIETQDYLYGQGSIVQQDTLKAYYHYLQKDIQLNPQFRISIDGFHGSAGAIAKTALQQLGCDVIDLHCEANGDFPLGAPDPSDESRLIHLKQSVLQHRSDLGIALDGDGDRLVVLDEQGKLVLPDRLIGLFAKMCLQQQANKEIVCDVKCSSLIGQTVKKYQGHLKMIRTGSSFLRNHLAQSQGQAIFGGEFAGHYVFNDGRGKGYDDGLYAGLRLLEYMHQQRKSLSEILQEFPERVATSDVYIACDGADGRQIMQLIEKNAPKQAQIIKVDGLRLDFPFGFGIIRPSNTGEYFTVRFDADNQTHFEQVRQHFVTTLAPHYPTIAHAMAIAH